MHAKYSWQRVVTKLVGGVVQYSIVAIVPEIKHGCGVSPG